jgi:hypothetical protein
MGLATSPAMCLATTCLVTSLVACLANCLLRGLVMYPVACLASGTLMLGHVSPDGSGWRKCGDYCNH